MNTQRPKQHNTPSFPIPHILVQTPSQQHPQTSTTVPSLASNRPSQGRLRGGGPNAATITAVPKPHNTPSCASFKIPHILVQTTTTEFTKVPIPPIDMLTTSPSAKVNSGGGIVPVPVQTVVPFGT